MKENEYKQEILKALDKGTIGESAGQIIGAVIGAMVGTLIGMFNPALGAWVGLQLIAGFATLGAAIGGVIDPPKPPEMDFGNDLGSPRYGFGPLTNTFTNEIPVPILYGELKIAGNIIYQSEPAETIYRCIGLCEGPIETIEQVLINDISIDDTYQKPAEYQDIYDTFFETIAAMAIFARDHGPETRLKLPGCSWTPYPGYSDQVVDPRISDDVVGLRYLAYLALTLAVSDHLKGGNPTITCVVKGLKVSTWNGSSWTVEKTYSRNPVACLRDLLTNSRYGGGVPEAAIDATTWGSAYEYCDGMVQNVDATGTEVRYRLDYIIDGKKRILDALNDILATFNGFLVFSGSKIKLKIEREEAVQQAFTMANIISGSFGYSKASKDELPNRIKVQYIDPDFNYVKIYAQADDPVDQANRRALGLGEDIVSKEVSLLGITRFSQAARQAKTFLYLARACGIYCTFKVGPDALAAEVGDVISVSHDVSKWSAKQFRILAIQATKDDKLQLACREYNSSIYTGYLSGQIDPDYYDTQTPNIPPNEAKDFRVIQDLDVIRFTWTKPIPKFGVEIAGYEIRQGVAWHVSSLIATMATGLTWETSNFSTGALTYWIKPISTFNVYSENGISDSIVTALPYNFNAVFTHDEWDPASFNNKVITAGLTTEWTTDRTSSHFERVIVLLNDTYTWDDVDDLWDNDDFTWDPQNFSTSEQTFTGDEIDVGSEQTAPITMDHNIYDEGSTSLITIEWRYKEAAGTWADWQVFNSGEYTLRYFQFRVKITSDDIGNFMKIITLSVEIDVEDIIDRGSATIEVAGDGIEVTYNQTYTTTPKITVSTRGSSPYNPLITASSNTTFTIKLRDPETQVYQTGTVDWHSVGY